jgi:uncharacterized protein (DUF1015 family)
MAEIHPFRALRYNSSRVSLPDVVTQPYDKITPEMRERYYAASPANLVRIILGKPEPGDSERNNVYTRAAQYFSDWRRGQIFCQDDQPSFYVYAQRFTAPGTSGAQYERRGFIGAGKLEEYGAGVIFRHEATFSGIKTDRLNLLRATRAHFGQLFMLYDDPQGVADSLLRTATAALPPVIDVNDEYGVQHRVWQVWQPEIMRQVQQAMAGKQLIIADGHHRYETALNYRNEMRQRAGEHSSPDAPFERVMMTFVNMAAEGLLILPTHRVLAGVPGFDIAPLIERARQFFQVNPLRERVDAASAARLLHQAGANGTALVAVTAPGDFILQARPEANRAPGLAGLSPRQRQLDVCKLHKILLEDVLKISETDIRDQTCIHYVRDAGEAIARVRQGADVAFLMNPVPIGQVREVAFAGEVLPQKSTDFYPKLLSGLTVYALE